MNNETVTDALLRKFLLGNISDEDRERIESLFLTDPHARERVLTVEQDLIEDFLEGTLSAEDRKRFVSRFGQTAEQRRKLRITKSIKDWAVTEATTAQATAAKTSGWSRLRERLRLKPSFAIPVAATALIAIVVAGIWLSRPSEHAAIEQDLAQLNAPSNQQDLPVSLDLIPVTVRGTKSESLNPNAQGIFVLRLLWIQPERYPSYRATIHRLDETKSYVVHNLQPDSDGKAIRLKLRPRNFSNGTYQVMLTGLAADGSTGITEEYTFNVGK